MKSLAKESVKAHWRVSALLVFAFLLAWFLGLFARFSTGPQELAVFLRIARLLGTFLLSLIVVLVSFLAGRKLLRSLGVVPQTLCEDMAFSAALGLGVISIVVLVIGLCRGLYIEVAYGLLFVGILGLSGELSRFISSIRSRTRDVRWDSTSIVLVIAVAACACIYLPAVFAPPLNYDSLTYHIGIPKLFVLHHRVFNVEHNVYAQFPFGMEMLYTLALLLEGDVLAKLINFWVGLLLVSGIVSFALRHINDSREGRQAGLASAFIFYNIPLAGLLSGWLFVDLGLGLFQFLGLAALLNYLYAAGSSPSRNWLVLSGVMAGLSVSVKLSAAPLGLAVLAAILIATGFARGEGKRHLRDLGILLLVAFISAAPWFLKSLFYTGNPVYPFLYRWFSPFADRLGVPVFDAARFMAAHLPRDLSFVAILQKVSMDKEVGPALAVFLPILIFLGPLRPPLRTMLCYGGLSFLVWAFATHQEARFLLPSFPPVCIAAGCAYAGLRRMRSTRIVATVALAAVSVMNTFWVLAYVSRYDYLGLLTGVRDRQEYLLTFSEKYEGRLYQYPAFDYINRALPSDAKVLFIGENQGYYCDRDFVGASPFDTNPVVEMANISGSTREIAGALKREGFTHILFNGSELSRAEHTVGALGWSGPESQMRFMALFQGDDYLKLLFRAGSVGIYEIEY